jgi:hypothetical protein
LRFEEKEDKDYAPSSYVAIDVEYRGVEVYTIFRLDKWLQWK